MKNELRKFDLNFCRRFSEQKLRRIYRTENPELLNKLINELFHKQEVKQEVKQEKKPRKKKETE